MAIFEKGLSYNFMVERIAEAKGNYYYVIVIDNKECSYIYRRQAFYFV